METVLPTAIDRTFEMVRLTDLQKMRPDICDHLPFGVIGLDADGIARIYNRTEARMAGLDPKTVLNQSFFDVVAQCMNNFMVAQRFEDEPDLDKIIRYTLTLRMRPTPVRLRLLAGRSEPLRFILVDR
jgi:photoactive yellow protein